MKRLALILGFTLLTLVSTASARTWYVNAEGSGDAPTIQAGIDSASTGDTVLVACGMYYDCTHPDPSGYLCCVIMKSGVCLRSETGQPECAIIDAQQQGRVLYCQYVDSLATIEGFTLTGGIASGSDWPYGGGVYCQYQSSPTFVDCILSENYARMGGGGMKCLNSSPSLVNCTFFQNSSGHDGGGLQYANKSPRLSYCSFIGNSSGYDAGGVHCITATDTANFSSCTFSGNSAYRHAGGMYAVDSSVMLENCIFSDNSAGEDGGGVSCYCYEKLFILSNCTLHNNSAGDEGGAVRNIGTPLTLSHCTLFNNSANQGGGLSLIEGSATITGCTFFQNSANYGSAIQLYISWSISLDRTIMAFGGEGEAVLCNGTGSVVLTCCDIYGNEGGDWVGCIGDQYGTDGNFSACPSFCSADMGDFRLCDQSPCLPGNHPDGYDCGLIGAWGMGCACGPTGTESTTWGSIKSMHR